MRLKAMSLTGALVLATAGCATLFNSDTKNVAMQSDPADAEVLVNGNPMGRTPITLELSNHESYNVVFQKDGYEEVTCQIGTSTGAGWIVLDVFGGLLPVIIDAATGEWHSLDKSTCNVNLPTAAEAP